MLFCGGSLAGRVKDPWSLYGWLVRNVERLIEDEQVQITDEHVRGRAGEHARAT